MNVSTVFNVQTPNLLAFGARLVRLQLHAQNIARQTLDIINALGHFHAAALTATTCVNLRLDHPHGAAQLLRGFHRLLHRERGDTTWHWYTKVAQDFLALVLVNLHEVSLGSEEQWIGR